MARILVLERGEDLAAQVREVADDLPGSPEVVACTRVGSASHVQEHDGPFEVIVAGPSLATKAGLKRLAGLRRDMPGGQFVIAFDRRPDASLRDIVQVGAIDLIEWPTDDAAMRSALKRALDMAEVMGTLPVPAGDAAQAAKAGARVFTVCSATGGCGKTFYATNLAMFLARHTGGRVALVDLDLQFGEITTALRLQPAYTIVDAVAPDDEEAEEPASDLSSHIEDYLVRYRDQFWTLAAPREPSQADEIAPMDATRVIEALRQRFDYIVIDTPTALAETVLAAFDLSEHLFVLATLDLPSIRNLSVFLQTLEQLQIPAETVSLILNKVERDVGMDPSQLQKLFPQGFHSTLPYAREVSRSINVGEPVIANVPESLVSQRLEQGFAAFLSPEDRARYEETTGPAQAPRRAFGLFRRRERLQQGSVR